MRLEARDLRAFFCNGSHVGCRGTRDTRPTRKCAIGFVELAPSIGCEDDAKIYGGAPITDRVSSRTAQTERDLTKVMSHAILIWLTEALSVRSFACAQDDSRAVVAM